MLKTNRKCRKIKWRLRRMCRKARIELGIELGIEIIMESMAVKDRIGKLLSETGMSQKALADATNLSEGAVSHYLKGDRVPKGAILLNIANALGTTVDYLTGKSDDALKFSSEQEIEQAFELIARNAKTLTDEERKKFAKILFS